MLYLVEESGFCGSITMFSEKYGIEAASFDEAKDILEKIIRSKGGKLAREDCEDRMKDSYLKNENERFSYIFPSVQGTLYNEEYVIKKLSLDDVANPPIDLGAWSNRPETPKSDDSYDVILNNPGETKSKVAQAIRKFNPYIGCEMALSLVKNTPCIIQSNLLKKDAEKLKEMIEMVGGEVEIKN